MRLTPIPALAHERLERPMDFPIILPDRHPLASGVEVWRPYNCAQVRLEMPVEAEYIDFAKAQVEDAAALCMDAETAKQASALCAMASRAGAGPPPSENAVYVVAPKSREACKIGMAKNPAARLSGIQTGSWQEMELCGIFWCIYGNAEILERAAINAAKAAGFHLKGEWFDASPEFLAIVIAASAKGLDTKVADSNMWMRQREAIRRQRKELEFTNHSPIRGSLNPRRPFSEHRELMLK